MLLRENANISCLEPLSILEFRRSDLWKIPVFVEDTWTLHLNLPLLAFSLDDSVFFLVIQSDLYAGQGESYVTGYTSCVVESGAEQDTATKIAVRLNL
jgi:hypothetical protein